MYERSTMQSSCFLLLHTSSRHPVVGIAPSENETELIVTLQGTGVQVHEVKSYRR